MKRHHWIAIALIIFALIAVVVGLFDPQSTQDRSGTENAAALRQIDDADNRAGFPDPAHPDQPPRGPGE